MSLPTPAEWRPVPGYPDYFVSSEGEVYSRRRRTRPGLLAQDTSRSGYRTVKLINDDGKRRWKVHRLVLAAFVGPCPEGQECRHLDGNQVNNRLENLAYGTRLENMRDRIRHGTSSIWKTHCRSGLHRLSPENVVVWNNGDRPPARRCRICAEVGARKRYARWEERKRVSGGNEVDRPASADGHDDGPDDQLAELVIDVMHVPQHPGDSVDCDGAA